MARTSRPLRHFYETILGLDVRRELADQFVFFHCGEGMLLVFNPLKSEAKPRSFASAPPHGAHGPGHVCFAASAEELDMWRRHLEGHVIAIEADFEWPGGGRSIYCRDPAGNSVEFAEPRIWGLPRRSLRDAEARRRLAQSGQGEGDRRAPGPIWRRGHIGRKPGAAGARGDRHDLRSQCRCSNRKPPPRAPSVVALADDSGLCVDALDGDPGIYSARWAGPTKDFALAMRNVEEKLQAQGATMPEQRRAHFVSVLSVAWPDGHVENFEGRVAWHAGLAAARHARLRL